MRGPSKSLPKYRKYKRTGQAVVTLSGVDHYLGPHGTKASEVMYDRLVGEWVANGRELPPDKAKSAPSIRILDLCARYLKYALGYYV